MSPKINIPLDVVYMKIISLIKLGDASLELIDTTWQANPVISLSRNLRKNILLKND